MVAIFAENPQKCNVLAQITVFGLPRLAAPTLLEPRRLPVMDPPAIDSANRGPTPPIVVKLVTDDPNIIIGWLIDSERGDGV